MKGYGVFCVMDGFVLCFFVGLCYVGPCDVVCNCVLIDVWLVCIRLLVSCRCVFLYGFVCCAI